MLSSWGGWLTLAGELAALSAVVALSPFTVVPAMLLVVHSERPRTVGPAFIGGWLVSKAAITAAFLQLPRLVESPDTPAPVWSGWLRIGVGAALLLGAALYGRRPPAAYRTPRWLDRIKRISPAGAAATGAVLTVANIKVLIACAAAGYVIGTAHLGITETVVAVTFFTMMGGSTAALPILAYTMWAHRIDPQLERFRLWLQRRQRLLTLTATALIGLALIYSGVHAL